MTAWTDVVAYIERTYASVDVRGERVNIVFEVGGMRTQIVQVSLVEDGASNDWVHIESPIGLLNALDLDAVLDVVEEMVCGGISRVGDLLTLRHCVRLEGISISDFDIPLRLITSSADRLEKRFTGADDY